VTQQAVAWIGILLLIVGATVGFLPGTTADVRNLQGSWPATITSAGTARTQDVSIPALFATQGIPSDARVQIRIPIELRAGPHALWIDRPQYAIDVYWDGEPIAQSGDPSLEGSAHRTDHSLLAPLPDGAGPHELVLDVKGDFGEGGIVGRVLVGPVQTMLSIANRAEAEKVGFALGLGLLALVHLSVASLRARRPAYLFFGVFLAVFAVWTFASSDLSYASVGDPIRRLRISRVGEGLLPGLLLLFLSSCLEGKPKARDLALLAFGASTSAFAIVASPSHLYAIEVIQDANVLVTVGLYFVLAAMAFMRRVRGSALLILSLIPLTFGAVDDILLSHGLQSGDSSLFLGLLLFIAGCSVALALAHAEDAERHRRFVTGSVDAMVGLDALGRLTDANPAANDLLATRVLGHNLLEWVAPADRPIVRGHIARSTTRPDRAEFRLAVEDREIVVESIATPLDNTTSLLVLRDVTRRRQLDHGLVQAARMETVAVLLGGIAHDFNNMLGTLLAHVGFLQATLGEDAAQTRLGRMESTIERASILTRRLLTVAGGTGSDLGAMALAPVCRGAAELVEPTLPPGVQLVLDVPEDLPPVLGAAADLEHVLVNLLVNARDALGAEGRISLVARSFLLRGGARGVLLVVEDNGPGVPEAIKEEVFAPFFTTKGPHRGTGLGLAVASQILRDHHGRFWLEDRPEGGARFCAALRHADTMDKAPAPLPDGRRVLLVEDEQILLDAFATALREAGYLVHTCSNGDDAWRYLHREAPDILVTDVVMPGLSGIELATSCRTLHPRVPVLLVSGFIPDGALGLLDSGTFQRLDKPVRAARLVATVGRLCRRAERAAKGELDITEVTYLFPPLEELTAATVGL
jgi:PAS domain S-box-containing protein